MCAAWLPHLKTKKTAYLINISSGLAFVPLTRVPSYCATKVRGGRGGREVEGEGREGGEGGRACSPGLRKLPGRCGGHPLSC